MSEEKMTLEDLQETPWYKERPEIVMMSIKKSDDILGNLEDKFFTE